MQARGINQCVLEHILLSHTSIHHVQIRVDAQQPIAVQKGWRDAKKKHKSSNKSSENRDSLDLDAARADTGVYEKEIESHRGL
jgi:hypothetical protein